MTPDERQMISGLFDRIRSQAGAQRDPQAEALISDNVRAQPYAPYLLAQTVLVQEQALNAASERLKALEAQVQSYQSNNQQAGSGGFLGNLGRSIFGGNEQQPQRPYTPQVAPQQNYAPPPPPNYQQQPAPGPWSQQPQQTGGGLFGGGGFMRGALGMAAGVAGGALLADGIRDLFGGNHGGFGGGFGGGGVVENVENVYVEQPGNDFGGMDSSSGNDFASSDGVYDSDSGANDDFA